MANAVSPFGDGKASERILARLRDDFSIEPIAGRHTRLVGEIRDPAHLHGVINQLISLAIDIVSLTPVAPTFNNSNQAI